MKNFKINLFSVILSILITLLITEFLLRLTVKPFSSGAEIGIFSKKFAKDNYILDEEGFRNDEVKPNADILFLGDSFTFGSGVKFEDTFFKLFSDYMMNENNVISYNIALPNTNTLDHLKLLKEYNPKENFILIYQYFYNDIDYLNKEIISNQQIDKNISFKIIKNIFLFLSNNSYTFDYFLTPLLIKILTNSHDNKFKLDMYKNHLEDVKNIFDYAHNNNGKVIFIPMPMLNNESFFNKSLSTYIKFFEENFSKICYQNDVFMNITKNIDPKDKNLKVNNRDAHPSSEVHIMISKTLMKIIKKEESVSILNCIK
jgi:hypothetical protein